VTIIEPFYTSTQEEDPVWHDNDKCEEGQKIKQENRIPGKNGRKCRICEKLDSDIWESSLPSKSSSPWESTK
jgi:hypothetical protein